MSLSHDALIFGMSYLNGPKARLSFGGEDARMGITDRARSALNELLEEGYAMPVQPDRPSAGREGYRGSSKEPHIGMLAIEAGIDPFDGGADWTTFELVGEPEAEEAARSPAAYRAASERAKRVTR